MVLDLDFSTFLQVSEFSYIKFEINIALIATSIISLWFRYLYFLLRMDERLEVAAKAGDIEALYALLKEDAFLLQRVDEVPFIDTPLHIAASAGHVYFALEIMRLKPSYARKLNQDGFTPIHLALQNQQTQIVLRLVEIDRDLVQVQGREGKTPLHFSVECDMVDILAKFLSVCPKSVQVLTIRKETALHTAVKSDNLDAVEVLLGWLEHVDKDALLKSADDEGNTILHLATSKNQIEACSVSKPELYHLHWKLFGILHLLLPLLLLLLFILLCV